MCYELLNVLQFLMKSLWTVYRMAKALQKLSLLNAGEADESFAEELRKGAAQVIDTIGCTDEAFEKRKCRRCVVPPAVTPALTYTLHHCPAPPPDDNNCAFVDTPHGHDDLSQHLQVSFPDGWTQCLIPE